MALPTRKQLAHPPPVERHNLPIVLFVTARVLDPAFNLATEISHASLRAAWSLAEHWHVGAYMIMPDHVHFFCVPGIVHPANIKMWNKFWKGQFRRLMRLDSSIWQRDAWDTQMRSYDDYVEKRHYVRENPVRKGLAVKTEDWLYQGEMNVIRW